MQLTDEQQKAVDLILTAKIGVITGAAGSGKTTVTATALKKFTGTVLLVAPTGRAAKRLQEVTGEAAATIHRALGARRGRDDAGNTLTTWAYDKKNPLPYELVIVDETSMVDVPLMHALTNAIDPDTTRLILIGDVNQLPSVGPGYVFADIINSETVPVVRLSVVKRAAETTWVYRAGPKVLEGEWLAERRSATYKSLWSEDDEVSRLKLLEIVATRMPRAGITDYQVMSPMYAGALGVNSLNSSLQEVLNPLQMVGGEPERGITFRFKGSDVVIRERDRVVQTKNDYERGVFNGDLGTVKAVTPQMVKVDFDIGEVEFDHDSARKSLQLAYALTIHRMQGSQAKWAIVCLSKRHIHMWNRQLLYTAITRAREGVVVIGNRGALVSALSIDGVEDRITFLQSHLSGSEEIAKHGASS